MFRRRGQRVGREENRGRCSSSSSPWCPFSRWMWDGGSFEWPDRILFLQSQRASPRQGQPRQRTKTRPRRSSGRADEMGLGAPPHWEPLLIQLRRDWRRVPKLGSRFLFLSSLLMGNGREKGRLGARGWEYPPKKSRFQKLGTPGPAPSKGPRLDYTEYLTCTIHAAGWDGGAEPTPPVTSNR